MNQLKHQLENQVLTNWCKLDLQEKLHLVLWLHDSCKFMTTWKVNHYSTKYQCHENWFFFCKLWRFIVHSCMHFAWQFISKSMKSIWFMHVFSWHVYIICMAHEIYFHRNFMVSLSFSWTMKNVHGSVIYFSWPMNLWTDQIIKVGGIFFMAHELFDGKFMVYQNTLKK